MTQSKKPKKESKKKKDSGKKPDSDKKPEPEKEPEKKTEPDNKPKSKDSILNQPKKLLKLLGLVAGGFALIGISIFLWTSVLSGSASGWKTHTNQNFKYSIQYPASFGPLSSEAADFFYESDPSMVALVKDCTIECAASEDDQLPDAYIQVNFIENPENKTLQELLNQQYEECVDSFSGSGLPDTYFEELGIACTEPQDVSGWSELIVDGQPAVRSGKIVLGDDAEKRRRSEFVFITVNQGFYTISENHHVDYDFGDTFEMVLDSFTILE